MVLPKKAVSLPGNCTPPSLAGHFTNECCPELEVAVRRKLSALQMTSAV
jgi:hypothetical protein